MNNHSFAHPLAHENRIRESGNIGRIVCKDFEGNIRVYNRDANEFVAFTRDDLPSFQMNKVCDTYPLNESGSLDHLKDIFNIFRRYNISNAVLYAYRGILGQKKVSPGGVSYIEYTQKRNIAADRWFKEERNKLGLID